MDIKVGIGKKVDFVDVVKVGYEVMLDGDVDVVVGWKNKLQVILVNVMFVLVLVEQYCKIMELGFVEY